MRSKRTEKPKVLRNLRENKSVIIPKSGENLPEGAAEASKLAKEATEGQRFAKQRNRKTKGFEEPPRKSGENLPEGSAEASKLAKEATGGQRFAKQRNRKTKGFEGSPHKFAVIIP